LWSGARSGYNRSASRSAYNRIWLRESKEKDRIKKESSLVSHLYYCPNPNSTERWPTSRSLFSAFFSGRIMPNFSLIFSFLLFGRQRVANGFMIWLNA